MPRSVPSNWPELPDEELLDLRMSQLPLKLEGTVVETRIEQLPVLPLQDGETLLQVSGVALTTNNITYALLGDTMQYWSFFPTHAAEWGQMPAWGFPDTPRWS